MGLPAPGLLPLLGQVHGPTAELGGQIGVLGVFGAYMERVAAECGAAGVAA